MHTESWTLSVAQSLDEFQTFRDLVRAWLPSVDKRQVNIIIQSDDTVKLFLYDERRELLGCTCYRVHEDADFADVQFFLTTRPRQGIGRVFMAMLSKRLFDAGVHFIALYSGMNAVGFFRKVGFADSSTSDLTQDMIMPRVEVFQKATQLVYDMTEEFLRPEAQ
jgi:hypothetical protein